MRRFALIATAVLAASIARAAEPDPIALHREAAKRLPVLMEELLSEIRTNVENGTAFTESDGRAFLQKRLLRDGLATTEAPVIAVGAHAGDPAYVGADATPIKRGSLLLINIAAKKNAPGAIYADITWVAFVGTTAEVPPRIARLWPIVRDSRETAISTLKKRLAAKKKPVTGDEIDNVARNVIRAGKHGNWFLHALGHSLGEEDLGPGPNLKYGDERPLEAGQCFTIEPGIYYPEEFGVRSGVDVCITNAGADVTSGTSQRELRAILD